MFYDFIRAIANLIGPFIYICHFWVSNTYFWSKKRVLLIPASPYEACDRMRTPLHMPKIS